jgi:hypothetical protein
MAAILALGCALGLIAIINASPSASTSVAERVSDKLGQPATCVQHAATVTADHPQTIYRCIVGSKTQGAAQCFAVSGREIQQLGGRRDLRC